MLAGTRHGYDSDYVDEISDGELSDNGHEDDDDDDDDDDDPAWKPSRV